MNGDDDDEIRKLLKANGPRTLTTYDWPHWWYLGASFQLIPQFRARRNDALMMSATGIPSLTSWSFDISHCDSHGRPADMY